MEAVEVAAVVAVAVVVVAEEVVVARQRGCSIAPLHRHASNSRTK